MRVGFPALLLNYSLTHRADKHFNVNVFVGAYIHVVCFCKAKEKENMDRWRDTFGQSERSISLAVQTTLVQTQPSKVEQHKANQQRTCPPSS